MSDETPAIPDITKTLELDALVELPAR